MQEQADKAKQRAVSPVVPFYLLALRGAVALVACCTDWAIDASLPFDLAACSQCCCRAVASTTLHRFGAIQSLAPDIGLSLLVSMVAGRFDGGECVPVQEARQHRVAAQAGHRGETFSLLCSRSHVHWRFGCVAVSLGPSLSCVWISIGRSCKRPRRRRSRKSRYVPSALAAVRPEYCCFGGADLDAVAGGHSLWARLARSRPDASTCSRPTATSSWRGWKP
jgi:hypothetical protein